MEFQTRSGTFNFSVTFIILASIYTFLDNPSCSNMNFVKRSLKTKMTHNLILRVKNRNK